MKPKDLERYLHAKLGVQVSDTTVRYWENIGLISPVPREKTHRDYKPANVVEIELTATLDKINLPKDIIKDVVSDLLSPDERDPYCVQETLTTLNAYKYKIIPAIEQLLGV